MAKNSEQIEDAAILNRQDFVKSKFRRPWATPKH